MKVDLTGAKYNWTRLTWNYDQNTLVKDIPNYVEEAHEKLGLRDIPMKHTPAPYTLPTYGQEQWTPDPLSDIPATPDGENIVEKFHGVLLYYSRTVDPTLLNGLGSSISL